MEDVVSKHGKIESASVLIPCKRRLDLLNCVFQRCEAVFGWNVDLCLPQLLILMIFEIERMQKKENMVKSKNTTSKLKKPEAK